MDRSTLWATLAATGVLVLAASFVAANAAAHGAQRHTAQQLGLYLPGQHKYIPPSTTTSTTPSRPPQCGSWSTSASPTGQAMRAEYGAITHCSLDGKKWVVAAYGNPRSSGAIGVFHCASSDVSCLNGKNAHPISGWRFFKPPYRGNVTVLMVPNAESVILDNAGHQLCFSLVTDKYGRTCPSA